MKVALCLSGQPRSFEKGFEYHKKNLLDHYDVDVYMHTWNYVPEEMRASLLNLYGGSLVCNAPPKTEAEINNKYKRIPSENFPAWNTYSMLYGIWCSIYGLTLRDSQSYKRYDVIVRSRYDYALNIVPPLEDTLVNKVYVPSDRMTIAHDFCADMFAWGTPTVMLKYSGVFNNIDQFYAEGVTMIGEDMLAAQLKRHGLVGQNMIYCNMENPFEAGPYNGNKHSLIRDDFRDWNKLRG